MTRTTLARVLSVVVGLVSISVLFWPRSGPEPIAAMTTTTFGSEPWVDRTTPVDEQFLPTDWERRIVLLEAWVEEARGLDFRVRPRFEFRDEEVIRESIEGIYAGVDFDPFELVPSLMGTAPETLVNAYAAFLNSPGTIPTDLTEVVSSDFLVTRLVPELTDQHYGYRQTLLGMLETGFVGDQYEAFAGLVIGDAQFVSGGYRFYLATGSEWEPDSGCLEARIILFRSVAAAGTAFVCRLYASGGWDAVNAAYADPPQSTAELLGIDCDAPDAAVTPLPDWLVLFEGPRGPIWFALASGDISAISGWCFDHQRVVERGDARMFVMEAWLGSPADAETVRSEAADHFLQVPDLQSLVVVDGTWVGIATTRSAIDLCGELPEWCDR